MPIILIHVHRFIAQSHVCTLNVVLTGMDSMPEPVELHDVHVYISISDTLLAKLDQFMSTVFSTVFPI